MAKAGLDRASSVTKHSPKPVSGDTVIGIGGTAAEGLGRVRWT